jgi:hypothetical protein
MGVKTSTHVEIGDKTIAIEDQKRIGTDPWGDEPEATSRSERFRFGRK